MPLVRSLCDATLKAEALTRPSPIKERGVVPRRKRMALNMDIES